MTGTPCHLHGIRRCTICIVNGPFGSGGQPPEPDRLVALRSSDGTWRHGRTTGAGRTEHVVQCQDCPTRRDGYGADRKREWALESEQAAEAGAELHALTTGHDVKVLVRHTFTVQGTEAGTAVWQRLFGWTPPDLWLAVLRAGDCGDVTRSLQAVM